MPGPARWRAGGEKVEDRVRLTDGTNALQVPGDQLPDGRSLMNNRPDLVLVASQGALWVKPPPTRPAVWANGYVS